MIKVLFLLFSLVFIAKAIFECDATGTPVTITGIIMDNLCIEQGFLIDNSDLATLVYAHNHSVFCMVELSDCYNSLFTILNDPETVGGNYSVAYQLGEEGSAYILNIMSYAYLIDDSSKGFRITLSGIDDGSDTLKCVQVACDTTGEAVTVTGYIMDNLCIDEGFLIDNPDLASLTYPYNHSVGCMVQLSACYNSFFTILADPATVGGDYSVAYQLGLTGSAYIRTVMDDIFSTNEAYVGYRTTLTGIDDGSGTLQCVMFGSETTTTTTTATSSSQTSTSTSGTGTSSTSDETSGEETSDNGNGSTSVVIISSMILLGLVLN
jgi:hypothetical protein